MPQLLFAMALTAVLVVFSLANSQHVELYYVIGQPLRIRLIFLLAISFIAGSACTFFYQMFTRLSFRRRVRRSVRKLPFDEDVE